MPAPAPSPSLDALAYRPAQAARVLGVSTSRMYELIAAGHITARKASAQVTLIPRAELERYLDSLPRVELTPDAVA